MNAPLPFSRSGDLNVADEIAVSAHQGLPTIVFLVSHSAAGGAQAIWANIAEAFSARGYRVELAALYPAQSSRRETGENLSWIHVFDKRPSSPFAQISLVGELSRFFKVRPNCVVFTAMPAANVLAPIAARLSSSHAKVIVSHHSPMETYAPFLAFADNLVHRLGLTHAAICVSDAVKRSLRRQSRAAVFTIHNALPPEIEKLLAELAPPRPRTSARARLVVATGRLAPQKNYPILIRAAARLPDAHFNIIGAGPDEEALKSLAHELGVADRVTFLGHRSRSEALSLLSEGDIFVQPSLFEGHSLALIEAAKLGLPLVVSDVAEQVEGVTSANGESCGLTVPVHDDERLALIIRRLFEEDAFYADYAAKAQRLGSDITFDAMIDRYQNLLRST